MSFSKKLDAIALGCMMESSIGKLPGLSTQANEKLTEQQQTEATLHESESHYRLIAENVSDVIFTMDMNLRYTYISPSIERLTGYTVAEAMTQTLHEILPPASIAIVLRTYQESLERERLGLNPSHQFQTMELERFCKDGSTIWVETRVTYLRDSAGCSYGILGMTRDITARKQIEEALRQSEQQYRELSISAQRQAQELLLLDQVRTALTRELDLPLVFRTVVEAIAKTFGYTQVSLYLLKDDVLVLQHQVGYDQVITQIPVTQGISGRVIRTGQPVLLEDVEADPAFLGAIKGIVSEICVPLFDDDKVIGMLNIESTQGVRLTAADLRLMLAVGEHINLALRRAKLYMAVQRRAEELAALHATTNDLATQHDLPTLLQLIVERATTLLSAHSGVIYLYDMTQGDLELVASKDFPTPLGLRLRLGEGMAGRVAQTRQPLHVDNYRSWAGRTPQYDDIALTAVIGVPMIYQGELIGVLAVGEMGTTTRQFAESDAFLLDLFAAHTASAVHNTRLFETVQRLATTDSLTGVHNRRRLFELGEQELARSKRFGHPLAAIMLDIDHFKRVNDTYGHALGDQALRMVTQQCLKHIRAIDIVGRYGGEEFVILLPETEVAGACMLAERLRQCVAQTPIPTEQGSVHLTISLGIDRINTEQWDLTALLDGADHALYAAKQAGRNRIAVNPAPHAEQASAAL